MWHTLKASFVADTQIVTLASRTVKRHDDGLRRFRIGVRPWLLYIFFRLFSRLTCEVKIFQDCLDRQLKVISTWAPRGSALPKHWHAESRLRRPFSKHCIGARVYIAGGLRGLAM
jgi:hypothetical protein